MINHMKMSDVLYNNENDFTPVIGLCKIVEESFQDRTAVDVQKLDEVIASDCTPKADAG